MGQYLRPTTTAAALAALQTGRFTVLAGGTDVWPARAGRPADDDLLDLTAIPELHGVHRVGNGWRIGATTTWSDLIAAPLPPGFDCLTAAAREVGGLQVQNTGTVAGNLCNASPAADGVPALLALDAEVELARTTGRDVLPLADFIIGPRRTRRAPDQLVTAILLPDPGVVELRSRFAKLGSRRYLVISFVMAAAAVSIDGEGAIAQARIAVGACSPVAQRLTALERALLGRPLDSGLASLVKPAHFDGLAPIDDVRADADYRREAAQTLVARLLDDLDRGR